MVIHTPTNAKFNNGLVQGGHVRLLEWNVSAHMRPMYSAMKDQLLEQLGSYLALQTLKFMKTLGLVIYNSTRNQPVSP